MACVSHVHSSEGTISQNYNLPAASPFSHSSYPSPGPSNGVSYSRFDPFHQTGRPQCISSVPSLEPGSVTSARGALRVFAYQPYQGSPGVTITASLTFSMRTNDTTFLRLVLGRQALTTTVRKLSDSDHKVWELQATVPVDAHATDTSTVSLSAQALNSSEEILDSVTFGRFTYIHHAPDGYSVHTPPEGDGSSVLGYTSASSFARSEPSREGKVSDPSTHHPHHTPNMRTRDVLGHKSCPTQKKQSLLRSRRSTSGEEGDMQCATLKLEASVESMAKDWDADELRTCRRLVRFSRAQEGSTLKVSCERIRPSDYTEGDAVVSCIYRTDTDSCCVTSVDIIFLLECLIGQDFDIEEKNRIRRNLEGFRPKTVSKNRADSSDFFSQIMNFPPPKPRNIEKDLKVFEWNILPQALDKIISRYTLTASFSDSQTYPPSLERPVSSHSTASTPISLPDLSDSPNSSSRQSTPYAQPPDFSNDIFDSGVLRTPFHGMSAPAELPMPPLVRHNSASYYGSLAYSSAASTPMVSTPSCATDIPHGAAYVVDPQQGFYQPVESSNMMSCSGSMSESFILGDGGMMAFDSIEFQTLRDHKFASAHSDSYL